MSDRLLQMTPSSSTVSAPSTNPPPASAASSKPAKPKTPSKCVACDDKHGLLRCPVLAGFDVDQRNKLVRDKRYKLLRTHGLKSCPSKFTCRICHQKHHTLLHKDRPNEEPAISSFIVASTTAPTHALCHRQVPSFLNTVIIKLSANGRTAQARAIFDSGSGVSMMSETLASTLKLHRFPEPLEISGLLGHEHTKFSVVTSLQSNTSEFVSRPITFTVVSKLRSIQPPNNRDDILQLPQIKTLTLSDPQLGDVVDILLWNLAIDDCVFEESLRMDKLKLVNTPFGPLTGTFFTPTLTASAALDNLQTNLAKIWELDQVPEAVFLPAEDAQIIRDFNPSHQRVEDRFMIKLPRKENALPLGNSRRQAIGRLLSNEKALKAKCRLDEFHAVPLMPLPSPP